MKKRIFQKYGKIFLIFSIFSLVLGAVGGPGILSFSNSLVFGADLMLDLAAPENLPKFASVPDGYPEPQGTSVTSEKFQNPPAGFGEVPFWWWTGDRLDRDRLAWQIRELHEKGVTGMQINYAHKDTAGWPTYPNSPEIFTPEWWEFWAFTAKECEKYGMGIGLSTYTLDWTRSENLFNKIIYDDPKFHTRTLQAREVKDGNLTPTENSIGFWAYSLKDGKFTGEVRKLAPNETLAADASKNVRVWEFSWKANPGTLDPIHPQSGARVIEKFFQPFVEHNSTKDAKGLNWFFNDELRLGVPSARWWNEDLPEVFRKYKGYDLFAYLPGLFTDIGPMTAKIRMDYADVQLHLTEERYFKPIYLWHFSQGLIFGCDNNGRGIHPMEYGDYFRACRWYSAPGHDTPGGRADFIKGKVSSSIANLYQRPRVWLEGYHSLGWAASPNTLMNATNENYAYGCTLLNLHGLYYTTHGSMWEWAPPCYHFRMPYWKHLGIFLKNFERLSYVLSQGVWRSEIAVTYPTAPGMAGLGGNQKAAENAAFDAARKIYAQERDVTFIDDQSVLRAEIRDGKLCVSGMEFRVYVLPGMEAVRWDVLLKLEKFARAGGIVVCLETLPKVSDRAGAQDPELDQLVQRLFTAPDAPGFFIQNRNGQEFQKLIAEKFPADLQTGRTNAGTKFLHREVGEQNVYFVMGVPKNHPVTFRTSGKPELWDTMTGERKPLEILTRESVNGEIRTTLRMPVTQKEAALIVFQPDADTKPIEMADSAQNAASAGNSAADANGNLSAKRLDGAWGFTLTPTMDNQWGDFRLPITQDNLKIGAEARRFRYFEMNDAQAADFLSNPAAEMPESLKALVSPQANDSAWPLRTYGFGTQFFMQKLDPKTGQPAKTAPKPIPYAFSWRVGVEMNPGHQGYHGSKKNISDHFIALGKAHGGFNEQVFVKENPQVKYRLTTKVRHAGEVTIQKGGNLPVSVKLDGVSIAPEAENLTLNGRVQTLELEYASHGRGFWLLEKGKVPRKSAQPEEADIPPHAFDGSDGRTPLSMSWFDADCVPFEPFAKEGEKSARVGVYRFTAPPGLQKMVLILDEKTVGIPAVFVNGELVSHSGKEVLLRETKPFQKRTRRFECTLPARESLPAKVTVAACLPDSLEGGALFAEPIRLETGEGELPQIGDWSQNGTVLENYSGGALYSKKFQLSAEEARSPAVLNLGQVCATAEVRLNGKRVGTLVAEPWKIDVSGFLNEGENVLEIEVLNTLSNHYLTVPNRYRGSLTAGLIGPVELQFSAE